MPLELAFCPQDGKISGNFFLSLDFRHPGRVELRLLKRIVNCVDSHNVQRLELEVRCDIELIKHNIFSWQTLTFLNLWVYPGHASEKTLFPKSISLPALTTLYLGSFAFCASDNNARAEPFSAFNRLNTLVLRQCGVRDTQTLCISSATLVNFRVHSHSYNFYEIEFCTPNLVSFTFIGEPYQKLSGSSIAYVKHINIDARVLTLQKEPPQFLLNWLLELAYTKSLSVTASTLQVLSLNDNLLKMKLPSL
ncbi:F-box family protein, partial [Trifolium pratense]